MNNPYIKYLDNEILIEWIFLDCRFGISIDIESVKESSWFFVSREYTDCGYLPKELTGINNL